MPSDPVVAHISRQAVRGNLCAIRRRIPSSTGICVAIKADAYGHGVAAVLPIMAETGVRRLAVAMPGEGLELRSLGWTGPVLCMGPMICSGSRGEQVEYAMASVAADITHSVASVDEVDCLARAARHIGRPARVEIQIDTGMGRSGLLLDSARDLIGAVMRHPEVALEGLYTHFSGSDERDLNSAHEQLDEFRAFLHRLAADGLRIPRVHAANSAAIFRLPGSHLDEVRPGLSVYGYWPGPPEERPGDLRPVMRVVSRIAQIRRFPRGATIGYGRTFSAQRNSIVGVVPIGYADGYRRLLGNLGSLTVRTANGQRLAAPVLGRVSMDLVSVDLTDAPPLQAGDEITVIDDDPAAPNSVESLAQKLDTIPYEITTSLGARVRRVPVD